jgi:hypothetical protein
MVDFGHHFWRSEQQVVDGFCWFAHDRTEIL